MMVTWSIWCINEGFLIWIILSTYQSHKSKVWACITIFVHICIWYITWCLIAYSCMPVFMTQISMYALLIRIYRSTCACPCTPLDIHHTTRLGFWLPWICMFRSQRLEPVDSPGCWLVMRSGNVDHRQTVWGPIFSGPLLGSRVFLLRLVSAFCWPRGPSP